MNSKKIAIVTGAAKGIGKAIVERFVKDKYFVVAVDVDSENGNNLLTEYGKENVFFVKADICSDAG